MLCPSSDATAPTEVKPNDDIMSTLRHLPSSEHVKFDILPLQGDHLGWRWSEHEVEGVSVRTVLERAVESAHGDAAAGRRHRNVVAGALEHVRKRGVANSIPDPATGVCSNYVSVDRDLAVRFYWATSGRFLLLLMWRPCHVDEVVETRQHHESLIIAKAKYDQFIDQNGGEVNA